LKAHNPSINWATNKLRFDRCPSQCHPHIIEPTIGLLLPIEHWETQNEDYLDLLDPCTVASQRKVAHKELTSENIKIPNHESPELRTLLQHIFPTLAKTTVSTTLAKDIQTKEGEIPPEYKKYAKVFSDEEAQCLPKHQP